MPHDDFEIEPVPGLPETPPKGEEILWQGKPDWWTLAQESLSLWWVAGYFGLLALWRFASVVDLMPIGQAIGASMPFVILGLIVCGLLSLFAFIQAHYTLYTVTSSRVAMRIGAALTVTLNVPFRKVANASLDLRKSGTGTIALEAMDDTRLSYLVCWPHVRPWYMRQTQPALRCIPDAAHVARIIADAAEQRISQPVIRRARPELTVAAE